MAGVQDGFAAGLRRTLAVVRPRLPELNFITIHYAFFILVSMLSSVIFWGSSSPERSITYTDSLFLCVSGVTEAGLNTVNLSILNTWQQIILFVLIFIGSPVFVSCAVVYIRLNAFEKAFVELKRRRQAGLRWPLRLTRSRSRSRASALSLEKSQHPSDASNDAEAEAVKDSTEARESPLLKPSDPAIMPDERSLHRGRTRLVAHEADNKAAQCPSLSPACGDSDPNDHATSPTQHIGFMPDTRFGANRHDRPEGQQVHRRLISFTGVGARSSSHIRSSSHAGDFDDRLALSRVTSISKYDQSRAEPVTSHGWISRNSQFHGLTFDERHKLGGREYRAVLLLSFLVPLYIIMWQGLGAIALGAYVNNYYYSTSATNGQIPYWVGAFNAISAFGNSGMSLLDANMIAFQDSAFILVSMSLFILAGNTAYPIFLRSAIWIMWKLMPEEGRWAEDRLTCRFLLDHPRRVYTNMFPSKHTWWLAFSLVALNGLDWMFFELLSIRDEAIDSLPPVTRVLGGLFQAFAVRSGGFYVVSIPALRLSLQFLYVVMMYISVYPVTMTIRNSNVYEERSLGIFAEDIEHDEEEEEEKDETENAYSDAKQSGHDDEGANTNAAKFASLARKITGFRPPRRREKRSYFVRQQLRAQLAHDAWFLVTAIFIILIVESGQLDADPVNFSVFDVVFEVVSGYACVGLSVGLPYAAYSFSGSWHVLSKLVLCAVMLRGRHRGLPVAIDHAVQLPGQQLWDAEDEDGERRLGKLERRGGTRGRLAASRRRETSARPSRPRVGGSGGGSGEALQERTPTGEGPGSRR